MSFLFNLKCFLRIHEFWNHVIITWSFTHPRGDVQGQTWNQAEKRSVSNITPKAVTRVWKASRQEQLSPLLLLHLSNILAVAFACWNLCFPFSTGEQQKAIKGSPLPHPHQYKALYWFPSQAGGKTSQQGVETANVCNPRTPSSWKWSMPTEEPGLKPNA